MSKYTTEFVGELLPLKESVDQSVLNEAGFAVMTGMTRDIAAQLVERSKEQPVRKMCENDAGKRFKSEAAIAEWLQKERYPLPLVRTIGSGGLELVGFGWMGPGKLGEDEPEIAGARTTFAMRLYEGARGRKLAEPFARAIVVAHQVEHGIGGEWLEAWGDNVAALIPYQRVGFGEVARKPGIRGGEVVDRVYMTLGEMAA